MDPLQQLLSSITGETEQMNNIAPAPWQQELLDTVSPEKAQKRRIAQALAQASTAMATTPGDFLSGVSAAAATGANSYIQGGEEMDAERIKAMAAVDQARRKEREDRLRRLHDLYNINESVDTRTYNRQKYEDDQKYRRERDTVLDADRAEQRADRAEERRLRREGRDITSKQYANEQARSRRAAADAFTKWETGEGFGADETTKQSKWNDLLDMYGVDTTAQPGATSTTQGFQEGATATNPQTGERVIFRNGKWQPL